jgi:IPT/TIG domain
MVTDLPRLPLLLVALACLLALVPVAPASANKEAYVGIPDEIEGHGPCSNLAVSAAEHAKSSISAVQVLSAGERNDYEFLDDGVIKSWAAGGFEEANASVTLDVLEKGFPVSTNVIAESPRATVMREGTFDTGSNTWVHEVLAGQGIGVTASAGNAANNLHDGAEIDCDLGPFRSGGTDAFSVWEPQLVFDHLVAPFEKEVAGAIGIAAFVEYDTPVISSISSNTGPALGGQEITIEGDHLANARPPEYGKENFATITENTNTRLKFKTPEANESEGVVEASVKPKIATFGGDATLPPADQTYTYTETDKVPSREPTVTPIEVSKLSSTLATLSTTINVKDLQIGACAFEVEPVGGFSEGEEEEEEENDEVCEPLPKPFSYAAQPVSVTFMNLKPATTYYYNLFLTTKWDGRSGRYQSPFRTLSFKTHGTPAQEKKAEEERAQQEAKEAAERGNSKEPIGITPGLTSTTPMTTSLTPLLSGSPTSHLSSTFAAPRPKVSKKGLLTFPLSAPGPGTFTATATASMTGNSAHGSVAKTKSVRYGSTSVNVTRAGQIALRLSPSKAAVSLLRRKRRLRVHITLTFTTTSGAATSHVVSAVVHW